MTEPERLEKLEAVQMELSVLHRKRKHLELALVHLLNAEVKRCNKCRVEMGLEQFYFDARYSDKLYPYCRECKTSMVRQRQLERKAA